MPANAEDRWTGRLESEDAQRKGLGHCECENCEECHSEHLNQQQPRSECDFCESEWCNVCRWSGYKDYATKEEKDCLEPNCHYGKINLKWLKKNQAKIGC